MSELIVIFLILLVVFGASRLPALGEALGKTARGFRRGLSHDDKIEVSDESEDSRSGESRSEPPRVAEKAQGAQSVQGQEAQGKDRDASDAELVDKKG
jgi:sec-independent protein translocase protein TatA